MPSWHGGTSASGDSTQVSADPDLVGGRYRLIEQLGKGGAGIVYRAWDTKLEEDTAIKILQQSAEADGAEIGRFKREITTARKITHPNVIRIHDFGESGRDVFISMEILTGGTLGRRMKEGLSIAEALSMAIGVCEGVQAAHALGIVHRDLKPDNILFDADGRPKVVDFGLARLQMASTRTVGFSGTPFYMSPEHANGSEVTTRSDVYSLGIVFFQLFTGRLPFTADNFLRLVTMHCNEAPPSMRAITPAIPAELEHVVLRALEKDPKKRHANGGELCADLRRVPVPKGGSKDVTVIRTNPDHAPSLRMSGPVPMPVRDLSDAPPPAKSRTALLAVGVVATVLVIAGLGSAIGIGLVGGKNETTSTPVVTLPSTTPTAVAVVTLEPTPVPLTPATPAPTPSPVRTAATTATKARPTPARTPPPAPTPTKIAAAATMGTLKVTGNAYIEVFVDNVRVGEAPYIDKPIKPGAHVIKLYSPGPPPRTKSPTINVVAGKHYELHFDVEKNLVEKK